MTILNWHVVCPQCGQLATAQYEAIRVDGRITKFSALSADCARNDCEIDPTHLPRLPLLRDRDIGP